MIKSKDFMDILEQHFAYDRNRMECYKQDSLELIVCPILDTQFSDVFVLVDSHNCKWKKEKTIEQMLNTLKKGSLKCFRAFVLSKFDKDQINEEEDGTLPIWIVSWKNQNEKYILNLLYKTNIWEETPQS